MTKAEHTQQLRTPMLGIIFANVAHGRGFMTSQTSYPTLYGHFLRGGFWRALSQHHSHVNSLRGYTSHTVLLSVPTRNIPPSPLLNKLKKKTKNSATPLEQRRLRVGARARGGSHQG